MGKIVTVLGPISPAELGVCYPHEHLLTRLPPGEDADLTLDSEAAAERELGYFRIAGGRSLVEMSPRDYGRDAAALQRLAARTGVQIICATGFHKDRYSRPWIEGRAIDDLVKSIVEDLTVGIDRTSVRAGVIKIGTSYNTITDSERRAIEAAALASIATGAPISTHTEAGTMAHEQVELLLHLGVAPSRISVGHVDRRLDWDTHLALVQSGVCLIYDQISKEKYAPDARRIQFVLRLVREGYGDRIMFSSDLARKSYWPSYGVGGDPGLTYILWRFVPWLRAEGLDEEAIETILVHNPARRLQWEGLAIQTPRSEHSDKPGPNR